MIANKTTNDSLTAVVRVGEGRGFIVEGRGRFGAHRYVITAAHCLPFFPPCHGFSYLHERTYEKLLAPLGGQPSICCECLFADPIADIAVLGSPDNQELSERADAYDAFTDAATPLAISEPPSKPDTKELADLVEAGIKDGERWASRECRALLLSLSNKWFTCRIRHAPDGMLMILDAAEGIAGGMSGSPILAEDGTAIGVICLGSGNNGDLPTEGGPNPRLIGNLPVWFLKALQFG
jgi:hypothetical protein